MPKKAREAGPPRLLGPNSGVRTGSELLYGVGERGHHIEEIGDQEIVGDLRDRRFLVFIDRDDRLAAFHAGQVLDRA
jgi:hypothetical protein